jgi:putative salt-induced outer membrane protein YdiY
MSRSYCRRIATAVLLLTVSAVFLPAARAEEEEPGTTRWADDAELGLVVTQGNSESTSLSFNNRLWRKWERSGLEIKAGGLRVESEVGSRYAVEDAGGNIFVVDPDTEVTAENYYLNGRYRRDISDRFFWFTGLGWERNEFAGFDNRWVGEGGVGHVWYDREDLKFGTGYSVTVTKQDDLVDEPGVDDTFAGYRFSWVYENKFTDTTKFGSELKLDGNVDDSSRWRGDMYNSLTVSMSERLSLKTSVRLMYENEPSLEEVDLFDVDGNLLGTTDVELDELDTVFTVSLVVHI